MRNEASHIITNIKNTLQAREISNKDFALKLNVSIDQIEKWFSCLEPISVDFLPAISDILNVSYEYILNKPKKYSGIDESYFEEQDFKSFLDANLLEDTHIYRGQRSGCWSLMSSFCRYCLANRPEEICNVSNCKYCPIDSLIEPNNIDRIKKECSVMDPNGIFRNMHTIQLLAYLQHSGVPTPLLDWSYSPYVALFFAIKDAGPKDDIVLYDFNLSKYQKDFPEDFDSIIRVGQKPITILQPPAENINQLNQQGLFMFSKYYPNIEDYFQELYENDNRMKYLSKKRFSLSKIDKKKIMESFKRMNITERTLFPNSIHVAKDIVNDLFVMHLKEFLKTFEPVLKTKNENC